MTQDELRAALLLMGFVFARRDKGFMYSRRIHPGLKIRFHVRSDKVDITQSIHYGKWHTFTQTPQTAFDYIKEKLT